MGCRFPGNVNAPEEFWDSIINGGDGLSDIPPDRWNADAKFAPDFKTAGKISVKRGGFIRDITNRCFLLRYFSHGGLKDGSAAKNGS